MTEPSKVVYEWLLTTVTIPHMYTKTVLLVDTILQYRASKSSANVIHVSKHTRTNDPNCYWNIFSIWVETLKNKLF